MSARVDAVENIRQKLPGILFWVGIGLAPVAALLLLVAEGDGLLRIVAVLAVLAVVLIGLSITLRGDNETIRLAMHKTLLEEIDMLREDLRNDIARAAHSAVGERLQVVQDDVAALRHQLAAGRGEAWAAGAPPADSSRGDAPDGSRAGDSAHDAYAPAEDEPGERGEWRRPPAGVAAVAAAGVDSGGRHSSDSRGARGAAEGRAQVRASAAIPRPRSPMSGALVQHTETVQVTTRHTIVNTTSAGDVSGGRVYGAAGYDSGRDDPLSAEIGGSHGSSGPRHGRAEDWGDEAGQEDRWARSYSERTWSDGSWSQSDESWARGGDEAWSRERESWAAPREERDHEARAGRAAVSVSERRDEEPWSARPSWRDEGWRSEGQRDESWRDRWRSDDGPDWRKDPRWTGESRQDEGSGWTDRQWESSSGRSERGWGSPVAELPASERSDSGGQWSGSQWSASQWSGGQWSETGASGWLGPEPEREPVRGGRRYRDEGEELGWRQQSGRSWNTGYSDRGWR